MSKPQTINDLCDLVTDGTHYTPKDVGIGFPFLTVKDISDEGLNLKTCSLISERDFASAKSANCSPQLGDVLFSKDGTVGKVYVVDSTVTFAVLSSIAILRPKQSLVLPDYLGFALKSPTVLGEALRRKTGSAIRRIILSDLKKVQIPVPSIQEQRKVVAKLAKVWGSIQKRKNTISLIDNYLRSLFIEMFGDPEVSKSWPMVKIEDLAAKLPSSLRTGPFGSDLKHSEFVDKGVAVLGIDNVVSNEFKWDERRYITSTKYEKLKRYTVRPGDVLITIMGTVGKTCVVPDDIPLSINTKHLAAITLDQTKALPEFVSKAFLIHPEITAQLKRSEKGAIMAGLNLGIIKGLEFNLPPLTLQKRYVELTTKASVLKSKLTVSQMELDKLFQSLLAESFSGER